MTLTNPNLMSEQQREREGWMTVSTFQQLVDECLGVVKVLCVQGTSCTGKTWAASDWVSEQTNSAYNAAYIDCKGIAFGTPVEVKFDGVIRDTKEGEYPSIALDGIDIVVVDEPNMNRSLVPKLYSHTEHRNSVFTHRLLILLIQDIKELQRFSIPLDEIRCYTVAGMPVSIR